MALSDGAFWRCSKYPFCRTSNAEPGCSSTVAYGMFARPALPWCALPSVAGATAVGDACVGQRSTRVVRGGYRILWHDDKRTSRMALGLSSSSAGMPAAIARESGFPPLLVLSRLSHGGGPVRTGKPKCEGFQSVRVSNPSRYVGLPPLGRLNSPTSGIPFSQWHFCIDDASAGAAQRAAFIVDRRVPK